MLMSQEKNCEQTDRQSIRQMKTNMILKIEKYQTFASKAFALVTTK